MLRTSVIEEGIDQAILSWVYSVTDRSGEVPDLVLATKYFEGRMAEGFKDGAPALGRLAEIHQANLPLLTESEFRVTLDSYCEDVMRQMTSQILIESATILRSGITRNLRIDGRYQTVTVQGVGPAVANLQDGIARITRRLRRGAQEGTFQASMEETRADYERAERNRDSNLGVLSSIAVIDDAHRGLKRGELGLVLGFASHMKTSFCLNWFYKAAILHGKHVAFVPLETRVDVIRKLLVCLHATHPKFGFDMEQIHLTEQRLREGVLSKDEKDAFYEVTRDLRECPDYGRMIYKQPEDKMTVEDIKRWLEAEQRTGPSLDMCVVDYIGLVDPDKQAGSIGDFNALSRAIRLAKQLAMDFDNGLGIAMLTPYQANRTGLKEAKESGGRYDMRALAGTPEAERSADVIYYLYLDDILRRDRQILLGNIKTRNAPLLTEQYRLFCDTATRLIDNPSVEEQQALVEQGLVAHEVVSQ